jgi:hypothetical protein
VSTARKWLRGAAIVLSVGSVALVATMWVVGVVGELPVPPSYPGHGPNRRGFFLQGVATGLLPLFASISLSAAARVSGRLWRVAAVVVGAVAAPLVAWYLLIPGEWALWLVIPVIPAALYVLASRRPWWWLALPLGYFPLFFVLSELALY